MSQPNVIAAPIGSQGDCKRIRVRAANGRVHDLGKPSSPFFKFRLALYRWRRRRELNHG